MPRVRRNTCPPEILRQLREIDPKADVLEILPESADDMGSEWLLVTIDPNTHARRELEKSLSRELPPDNVLDAAAEAQRLEWLQLYSEGIRPVYLYPKPDGRMVEDFRVRDWNYRHRRKETFDARMDEADLEYGVEERKALLLDMVKAEMRSAYRFSIRKARSVLQRVNPLRKGA